MSTTSDAWPIITESTPGTPFQGLLSHLANHGIYRIADTAERATLISALAAAGVQSTRVYAHRQDAPAGSELEYTIDGGTTWRTIRASDTTPAIGEYTKGTAALDGTLAPVPFTTTTALAGVTNTSGSFTFATPGLYSIRARVASDDGTPDTGHEARLIRAGAVLTEARGFAPAGSSGLGQIKTPLDWVGAIRNSDTFSIEVTSIGAGGRSSVTAALIIERLTY